MNTKPLRETPVYLPLIQNILPFKIVSAIEYFIIPYSYSNLSQKQSKCPWQCCETVQKVLLIPLSAGLRFFTVSRLALNPNLIFEIGSRKNSVFNP